MQRTERVAPALPEQFLKLRARRRLQQRVVGIGAHGVNIAIGRHHVVIAGEHHRHAGGVKLFDMRQQAL